MQAGAVQAALLAHDRVRQSTDLPIFYGKKDRDTVTVHVLISRIEAAATIAGWDSDARKCKELYLILRDRALIWWDSLDNIDAFNKEVWADVKR